MDSLEHVTFVTFKGLGEGIGHVLESLGVGGVVIICSVSVSIGVFSWFLSECLSSELLL